MWLHLWQKPLWGKRHQMATAVPQRSYIQSSVLGWSPLFDMKDTGWYIYANFCVSSHAFWKMLVSFLHRKHMSAPHSLFTLNPISCFLANLLVNLKVFHPFSHNWCSDNVAQLMEAKEGVCSSCSSRPDRTWNSSEQILWSSEAPLFRSPFQHRGGLSNHVH